MAVRFVFDVKVTGVLIAGRRSASNPDGDLSVVFNFSKNWGKEQPGLLGKVAASPRQKMHNGKISKGHAHALFPDSLSADQPLDVVASSKAMQDALFAKGTTVDNYQPLNVQIVRGNRHRYDILTLDAVLTDEQKKPENIIGFAEIHLVADNVTVVARSAGKPPVVAATPASTPAATPVTTEETAKETAQILENENPDPVIDSSLKETSSEQAVQPEQPEQAEQPEKPEAEIKSTGEESEIGHLAEDRENPDDENPDGIGSALQSDIAPAVTEESVPAEEEQVA